MTGMTRAQLLLGGDVVGAGARRLAADVENVGALLGELQAVRDGGLRRRMQAAVGEAVGRDVDDAHDARTVERQTCKARARRGDGLKVLRGVSVPRPQSRSMASPSETMRRLTRAPSRSAISTVAKRSG